MTLSSTTAKSQFDGDGNTTDFPTGFKFLQNEDVEVIQTVKATGVDTTLTEGTDYDLTGAGEAAGGTVTFGTAPASTVRITIKRDADYTQPTALPLGGPLPSADVEESDDRIVMLVQQLLEQMGRSLQLSEGSTFSNLILGDPVANKLLTWDENAAKLVPTDVGDIDLAIDTLLTSLQTYDRLRYDGNKFINVPDSPRERHELGDGEASTASHPDIAGLIIEVDYHDSNRVIGSGARFSYTGITSAGDAGNWPITSGANAGKFADADGKLFENASEVLTTLQWGARTSAADNNNAHVAAIAGAAGRELKVPAGVFVDSATTYLEMQANTTVYGEGEASIIQFDNSTDPYADTSGSAVGMLNVRGNGCRVKHLKLDQNFRGSGRADGVDNPLIGGVIIGGSYDGDNTTLEDILIDDVTVYDYYQEAISAWIISVNNYTVQNCKCISTYIVQGWTSATYGRQGINMSRGLVHRATGNIVLGALDDAIAFHGYNDDAICTNNIITTVHGRILAEGIRNGEIANNTIRYIGTGSAESCLRIGFGDTATLRQNDLLDVHDNTILIDSGAVLGTSAIRYFGGGSRVRIFDNTIRATSNQATGIELKDRQWSGDSNYYSGDDVEVFNNKIDNFGTGIRESSTSTPITNCKVYDNKIRNCGTDLTISSAEVLQHRYDGKEEYIRTPIKRGDSGLVGPVLEVVKASYLSLTDNTDINVMDIALPDGDAISMTLTYLIFRAHNLSINFVETGTIHYAAVADNAGNITVATPTIVGASQALDGYSSLTVSADMTADAANNKVTARIKQTNDRSDNGKVVYTAQVMSTNQGVGGDISADDVTLY